MKLVFSACYSDESPILKLNPEKEKCLEMIDELLSNSNNIQGLVYVSFFRFEDQNEIPKTIFTSSVNEYIIEFVKNNLDYANWRDLTLCIFEFTSYIDAFNWCIELQKDN